ncbi:MAG: CopG family ribbon-helix-helix protein [Thermoproteus sp.]
MKRFGVSLPNELAQEVDKLSRELGVTRSAIVAQAVSAFVQSYSQHLKDGHVCLGAVLSLTEGVELLSELIEQYKELIANYSHIHIGDKCVSVFVVHGDGRKIGEFLVGLSERAVKTYFTPIE